MQKNVSDKDFSSGLISIILLETDNQLQQLRVFIYSEHDSKEIICEELEFRGATIISEAVNCDLYITFDRANYPTPDQMNDGSIILDCSILPTETEAVVIHSDKYRIVRVLSLAEL